jgi:hypothetical protein
VLQVIVFEFAFNTKKDIAIIPHVKSVKIFNAARDGKYACEALENWPDSSSYKCGAEALEKFGGSHKLVETDYAKLGVPDPYMQEAKMIINNLKGIRLAETETKKNKYLEELLPLVKRLSGIFSNLETGGKLQILESDLMSELIPESKGKTGSDLETYQMMFDDAMYMHIHVNYHKLKGYIKATGYDENKKIEILSNQLSNDADWKRKHGYLEGIKKRGH